MVVLNKNRKQMNLNIERFAEIISGDEMVKDVISGKRYKVDEIKIPAMTALVLEVTDR